MSVEKETALVDDWNEVVSKTNARDGTLSIYYSGLSTAYKVVYAEKGLDDFEIVNDVSILGEGCDPCDEDTQKIVKACERVMYSVGYKMDVRNFG